MKRGKKAGEVDTPLSAQMKRCDHPQTGEMCCTAFLSPHSERHEEFGQLDHNPWESSGTHNTEIKDIFYNKDMLKIHL